MDFNYHGPVVVFDLDDTLFRERHFCRSGFRFLEHKLVTEKGRRYIGLSKRMDSMLRRRENYFAWLEKLLGDDISGYVEAYRNHRPETLDFAAGVEDVLNALNQRGVRIGIVTDGRSVTQRRKIEALGLDRFVMPEDVMISEETGCDKLKPTNFSAIVRRYPEASRFIYVGDNASKDFFMPNLLGWTTCRVPAHPDNVHPRRDNEDTAYMPEIELKDIGELVKI